MTTQLTLRSIKQSPLTNDEMDTNFVNLRLTADQALAAAGSGTGGTGTGTGPSVRTGGTFPTSAVEGDLFFNTSDDQLYVYVSGHWVTAAVAYTPSGAGTGIDIVTTLPGSGTAGQVVFNKSDDKLYKWSGTAWVSAVPMISSTQITDGMITTPKLAANSITSDKLVANSIIAGKIAAGVIGATEIAAGAITGDKIAANSITAGKIAAGAITASSLSASTASATMNGVNFWLGGTGTVMGATVCFNLDKAAGGNIPMVVSASHSDGVAAYFMGPATGYGSGLEVYGTANIGSSTATYYSYVLLGHSAVGGEKIGMVIGAFGTNGRAAQFHHHTETYASYPSSGGAADRTVVLCNNTYGIQLYGSTVGTFTGAHDAVYSDTAPALAIGDIVVDVSVVGTPTINEAITRVELATTPNDRTVIGVVSDLGSKTHIPSALAKTEVVHTHEGNVTSLTLDAEFAGLLDDNTFIVVNAVGEGCVNVCGMNGDIEAGDLIVSSTIPGKGMKQADDIIRSCTVAKARVSVTFASPTEVKQIPCVYHCG